MSLALHPPDFFQKLIPRAELAPVVARLRREGRLVFTNGVFDVLHRGHVTYLARARALGRIWWWGSTPTPRPGAWARGRIGP